MTSRRKFAIGLAASLFVGGSMIVESYGQDHGKHKGHGDDGDDEGHGHGHGRGQGHPRYFRQEDSAFIGRYYQGPRNLPPGLAKKYYRTGTLPSGWQKRFSPFPPELIARLPPPPPNCDAGFVDGRAVVYDRSTLVIVDVLDITAVFASH